MSVFFTNRVNTTGETVCCAWSQWTDEKTKPLLAVALANNAVGVYTDEGEPLDKQHDPQLKGTRGVAPVALQWHPAQRLLAIGWADGVISFWNEQERRLSEDKQAHTAAITCMQWSADGSRLITGDAAGKIMVWKVERARPVPVVQYREQDGRITHLCLSGEPHGEDPTHIFYYVSVVGEKVLVCQADDKGHKSHLFELDSEAATLMYYMEKAAIVCLSQTSTLSVHTKEGSNWKTKLKVKLPTVEGTSSMQCVWAGTHVLATASNEDNMVRMFNLESEENFVLHLGDENALKKISCLAYNKMTNSLIAGTREGAVVMWKYVGTESAKSAMHKREYNPEDDWHLQPGVNLPSTVTAITWGPLMRLLAVLCADSAFVLNKCTLQHKVRGGRAVVQLSADKVVVEDTDKAESNASRAADTQMQVTGLDVTENHLALWSGRKAEIYEIGHSEMTLLASFATNGTSCGLHRDSFLYNNGPRVAMCNFQGTIKQSLVFDEMQGNAAHINVNGDFLAAVTHKHYLKMWKLTGREAKQHGPGPGRKIEVQGAPIGAIESIRVNCTGTKVSIVAWSHENSAKQDSRVVVYDTENDNFAVYDFASSNQYPSGHYFDAEDPKLLAVETRLSSPNPNAVLVDEVTGDEVEVTTLFCTSDDGVLFQETHQVRSVSVWPKPCSLPTLVGSRAGDKHTTV
eukprot:1189576-Prorocentrum_minimum.AAC.2